MSLLLHTHVVLWWLTDDPTLSDDIKTRLDHDPDIYVSAASVWEVTIKQAAGKLTEPADLPERIRSSGFAELAINSEHAIAAGRLPSFTGIPSTGCWWLRHDARVHARNTGPPMPEVRSLRSPSLRYRAG